MTLRSSRLPAALVAWIATLGSACVISDADDAGTEPNDPGSDSGTATASDTSSDLGGPPPPGTCAEQTTQEQCMAVGEWALFPHLEDSPVGSCGWNPTSSVVDPDRCEVQPQGGDCYDPSYDDGCEGLLGFPCPDGTALGYTTDPDGTVRIGRGSADCYTGALIPCPYDVDLEGNPVLADDAPAECACGCE